MNLKRPADWLPGSFTKNFGWGPQDQGLTEIHNAIRIGFAGKFGDVQRDVFRRRVAETGRPDYIAINFFLFNQVKDGENFLIADELVFQAIEFGHSRRFDLLALFAFSLSMAGSWRGARRGQRYPSEWARHYIIDRIGKLFKWQTDKVSANDIERFLIESPQYKAETTRKVSTNLNYLLKQGPISEFANKSVKSWWLDALFLTLDRTILDQSIGGINKLSTLKVVVRESEFWALSGPKSPAKELALEHFLQLYLACGGLSRFDEDFIQQKAKELVPSAAAYISNDNRPTVALDPTNPNARKYIPRVCAVIAKYAGFDTLDLDEIDDFDIDSFVRQRTTEALRRLREEGIEPEMTAEELLRLMRDQ